MYASVSKAVCWIDYAMTCYYGKSSSDFSSYWGFSTETCGVWMESKLADLAKKRDSAGGRFASLFSALMIQYQQCSVQWLEREERDPAEDISDLSRLEEERGYNTPVPLVNNNY